MTHLSDSFRMRSHRIATQNNARRTTDRRGNEGAEVELPGTHTNLDFEDVSGRSFRMEL